MGAMFRNPRLADSLARIAAEGKDAFYTGALARAIAADLQARGGLLTADDLAAHTADWVDTISTTYRGYAVHELPPSTQGFVALEMLNILEGFDISAMGHNSADHLHVVAEAKKIAFADCEAYLADRAFVPPSVLATLVSKEYAARRRQDIDMARAGRIAPARWTQRRQPRRSGLRPAATAVTVATVATVATPSTSPPPTARATSSRSSSRCSAASVPASSPATPASPCTTAARASRSRLGIPTRSGRASDRCTPWCRR